MFLQSGQQNKKIDFEIGQNFERNVRALQKSVFQVNKFREDETFREEREVQFFEIR